MQTLRCSGSETCWHHDMLRFPPVLLEVCSGCFLVAFTWHTIFTYMDLSAPLSPVFFLFTQSATHFASVQESKCIDTKLMIKWTFWDSIQRRLHCHCQIVIHLLATSGESFLEIQNHSPTRILLHQNLHFNTILNWFLHERWNLRNNEIINLLHYNVILLYNNNTLILDFLISPWSFSQIL